ncbi:MAG: hypothetical protein WA949_06170 [Phormidesmis sp.]
MDAKDLSLKHVLAISPLIFPLMYLEPVLADDTASDSSNADSLVAWQSAPDQTTPHTLTLPEPGQLDWAAPTFSYAESKSESTVLSVDFLPPFDDPLY